MTPEPELGRDILNMPRAESNVHIDRILQLIDEAEAGDVASVYALRQCMTRPEFARKFGGDLARVLELKLVVGASRDNVLFRESLECQLQQMRIDLAGPEPSPVETLLVNQVVINWLQYHLAEIRFHQRANVTAEDGADAQRSISAYERRFLAALKVLFQVQRLARPVLQASKGKKRLNVVG